MSTSQPEDAWVQFLNGDPMPWLLDDETPAVRHLVLLQLLDRSVQDPEVKSASVEAMQADPIAAILASQNPEGYWIKPGAGYAPKYTGTVWQVIFLDQLGADGANPQVHRACEYVLEHSQAQNGGFGASGTIGSAPPPPSAIIHCLNGNLLRALLGLGYLDDERVRRAIEWQARSITGHPSIHYYASRTSGPNFCCGANEGLPCAWGAIKALLALARVPESRRDPDVKEALDQGAEFLFSTDPLLADYPMGWGNTKPNGSWFKLGFPSGYVADVLQNLEVLCEMGYAGDPRIVPALKWLLTKQDDQGRWRNEYAYNGKTWVDFEEQGEPSKWVTLRACRVIKMAFAAKSAAFLTDSRQRLAP